MRRLELGVKSVEVLHSTKQVFKGKDGEVSMDQLTVLIEGVTTAPVTVYSVHPFSKGKCNAMVSVTGKAKGELKFSIQPIVQPSEPKGGKVA